MTTTGIISNNQFWTVKKKPMTPLNYSMTINKNLFRAPLCKWLYWKFRQSQILLDRYFCAHGVKWTFASLVTLPLIVLIHRTKFLHFYILMNWISLSTHMRQPIPSLINLAHSWLSKVIWVTFILYQVNSSVQLST